jgi:type 1 fimbria pilin
MNFPKKALLGSLLALSATSAFAIDTADLRVIGTIAPTACTPTFAGGGVVDYGRITTATLSRTNVTTLPTRTINYTITCDAPIALGTSWTDSRADSPNSNEMPAGVAASYAFGLGKHGSANIGRYLLNQPRTSTTGDGNPVEVIVSDNGSGWYAPVQPYNILSRGTSRIQSYAPVGTLVPGVYSEVSGTVEVTASISPTSTLDLTSTVNLDGLSVMTVRYL